MSYHVKMSTDTADVSRLIQEDDGLDRPSFDPKNPIRITVRDKDNVAGIDVFQLQQSTSQQLFKKLCVSVGPRYHGDRCPELAIPSEVQLAQEIYGDGVKEAKRVFKEFKKWFSKEGTYNDQSFATDARQMVFTDSLAKKYNVIINKRKLTYSVPEYFHKQAPTADRIVLNEIGGDENSFTYFISYMDEKPVFTTVKGKDTGIEFFEEFTKYKDDSLLAPIQKHLREYLKRKEEAETQRQIEEIEKERAEFEKSRGD